MITIGGGPPEMVTELVAEQLADPAVRAYLYAQGEHVGDAIAGRAGGLLPGSLHASAPPVAPSPWVQKVIAPLVAPVQAGALARVKNRLAGPALLLTLGSLGLAAVLGYAAGRVRR